MPAISAQAAAVIPPYVRSSEGLRRSRLTLLHACANPPCPNLHNNKKFCSQLCQRATARRLAADKKRASNPNEHVRILVGGKRVQRSHVLIERAIGRKLMPWEVVHHVDERKTHDCTWLEHCGCGGNLMIFPSQAAHMEYHHWLGLQDGLTSLDSFLKQRRPGTELVIDTAEYF